MNRKPALKQAERHVEDFVTAHRIAEQTHPLDLAIRVIRATEACADTIIEDDRRTEKAMLKETMRVVAAIAIGGGILACIVTESVLLTVVVSLLGVWMAKDSDW